MVTNTSATSTHWRDRAITAAEVISDAFDVAKAYGAHIANWILFFCLLANLIEMVSPAVEKLVGMPIVGIQSISLDVAGFGLTAMAASAKRRGDDKSAGKASTMGWMLISVMAITVGLITARALHSEWSDVIDQINQVLMFVRVIVTVFYGHIVHELRQANTAHENRLKELETEVSTLQNQIAGKQQEITARDTRLSEVQKTISSLQVQLSNEREAARVEVEKLRGALDIKAREVDMMVGDQAGVIDLRRELRDATLCIDDLQSSLDAKEQALKNAQMIASNLRGEVERLQQNEAKMRQQNEAVRQRGEAKNSASPHKNEAETKVRYLSDASASKKDLLTRVYHLANVEKLSSYEIAEQVNKPAKTIQRWLRDRGAAENEAENEATGTDE